jgi:phage-related tail fiber protein
MANLPETPQWEDGIYQIEVSDPVLGGPDGITNRPIKQLASRTLYLKQQVEQGASDLADHIAADDPHTQYAPKESPTFTGTPTAPTPASSDNSKKLATTEFVARIISALTETVSGKLSQEQNGADIPDPDEFVKNLGLGEGSALPVGVPVPWPGETAPEGWLKCNGATFTASLYPKLALAYPSGKLPDLRGEFIRGWDDGRGVDSGRVLMASQSHALEIHNHYLPTGAGSVTAPNTPYASIADEKWNSRVAINKHVNVNNDYAATYPLTRGDLTNIEKNVYGDVGTFGNETRPRNIAFNYIVRAA